MNLYFINSSIRQRRGGVGTDTHLTSSHPHLNLNLNCPIKSNTFMHANALQHNDCYFDPFYLLVLIQHFSIVLPNSLPVPLGFFHLLLLCVCPLLEQQLLQGSDRRWGRRALRTFRFLLLTQRALQVCHTPPLSHWKGPGRVLQEALWVVFQMLPLYSFRHR